MHYLHYYYRYQVVSIGPYRIRLPPPGSQQFIYLIIVLVLITLFLLVQFAGLTWNAPTVHDSHYYAEKKPSLYAKSVPMPISGEFFKYSSIIIRPN